MCSLLYALYGTSTRGAQFLNLVMSLLWLTMLFINVVDQSNVNIPIAITPVYYHMVGLVALVLGSNIMLLLMTPSNERQLIKTFSLLLGSLWHAVLANAFISKFPPLDMMMYVSVMLCIYFLGAVFYVAWCEGINVDGS